MSRIPSEQSVSNKRPGDSDARVDGMPLTDAESSSSASSQANRWSPKLPCGLCDALKELAEWWRPQIHPKALTEVFLDQLASIVVQLLFWGLMGTLVRLMIHGELNSNTEIPDFVGDFLKEVYQFKVFSRDVTMALVAAVIFALISWLPVVRRLQEDICRVLYVFGALTAVLGAFLYYAQISIATIGYNPAYIGLEAFIIGVMVAIGTELLMRVRAKFHFWKMVFSLCSAAWRGVKDALSEWVGRIWRKPMRARNMRLRAAIHWLTERGKSSRIGLWLIKIAKGAKLLWRQAKQCMSQQPAK